MGHPLLWRGESLSPQQAGSGELLLVCRNWIALAVMVVSSCGIARAATASGDTTKLIPIPREYSPRDPLSLARGVSVVTGSDPEDRFAGQDLSDWFEKLNLRKGHGTVVIELLRAQSHSAARLLSSANTKIDEPMQQEGYIILPTKKGLAVIASSSAGIFYGAQTVKQLTTGQGSSAILERAVIRDWPAMRYRGMLDDLSRGPFPTLDFQKRQIQTFAAYKLNVYCLHFENTLQYQSNPLPGLPGGSLSREDVRQLVDYARAYHVAIIPEQEAFGHLHHILEYEQYAPLAETPLGHLLAPGQPGSLQLISQISFPRRSQRILHADGVAANNCADPLRGGSAPLSSTGNIEVVSRKG